MPAKAKPATSKAKVSAEKADLFATPPVPLADSSGYAFTPEQLAWLEEQRAEVVAGAQTFLGATEEQAAAIAADPNMAVQVPTWVELSLMVGEVTVVSTMTATHGIVRGAPSTEPLPEEFDVGKSFAVESAPSARRPTSLREPPGGASPRAIRSNTGAGRGTQPPK